MVGGGKVRRPVPRHLGAMHLSGTVLLLTFLVPPLWMVNAAYATPPDDLTADAPFILLFSVSAMCLALHLAVQIPAGLLGSWLGRGRRAAAGYGFALATAGVLSLLLLYGVGWRSSSDGLLTLWADSMVRASLGLACYMWFVRTRVGSAPRRRD